VNVLVVAAHPDDEILGGGATFARLAREGHSVHLAVLGEGLTSRGDAPSADLEALHSAQTAAAFAIGAGGHSQHGLPDNRFDSVALLDVVQIVEKLVEHHSPEVVYTHHAGDLNIDHRVTAQAVLTATRPMEGCGVRELLSFEVPSSTEWTLGQIEPVFTPNVFVDVSATLEAKFEALECYASEMRPYPHPRSREAIEAIAKRWGSVAGCHAAEAFQLIRSVR
jgi:LmbE family N-acetylglucosaminyl deacetylase